MSMFRNLRKTYLTPQYLKKVSKIEDFVLSLTLFRRQSNNCLVCLRMAMKKRASEGEWGAFFFVKPIPLSRGYTMLDMAYIEMI